MSKSKLSLEDSITLAQNNAIDFTHAFAGTGQMVLRSMAFTFADAAGARVSGAVPRR